MTMKLQPMKLRSWIEAGSTQVKAIIFHPMETGLRKDKETGKVIPAKYITKVIAKHGDKVILDSNWGSAISKNPFMSFSFRGGKTGDKVVISWEDNEGQTGEGETTVA